ncbi:MAG: asparagine--tRNA ligase [Treponema sp. CETP13]|nr:MAG: asparagine--tRNA ligase [Treponema sp. CETP13]
MKTTLIKDILVSQPDGKTVTVCGWVRTKRDSKNLVFIQVNDGSCFASIQLTYNRDENTNANIENELKKTTTGASVKATGKLIESQGKGQAVEVTLDTLEVLGKAPVDSYPLQKKGHTFEFLREIAHLRPRTNAIGATARMRSQMAFAVHSFFNENGFQYVNTPIITASDAEGAGEMFQVTTLDMKEIAKKAVEAGAKGMDPAKSDNLVDYKKDFFSKPANLTVSGQLEAETYATALSRVYTFGPTFRAENSNTPRHLCEFWMIEPEMAFYDLYDDMDTAEAFLKYLFRWALEKCADDMAFFNQRIQKGIIDTLTHVVESNFVRISYTDAIKELEKNNDKFEFKAYWGCDLQTEHERYLTEQTYKKPVMVYNYPKEIKAFYMKANPDGKTVAAVDVLVPGLGEIIGGSEREADYDTLLARINELGLDPASYEWYLDLRKFGSVPHSGFGLGFERLIQYVTGMANIRDVIPFPRWPKNAEF